MSSLSAEDKLIEAFRNGDETAVKQLYDQYYRSLCYFAISLTGIHDEAEDVVVESFLKLLSKKQDFDRLADIRSFLFTVVRNACLDYLRRNKTKNKFKEELMLAGEETEQWVQDEEMTAKVLQLIYTEIESLPPQCRTVFKSIFFHSKTTEEIASELGLSRQNVLNQKSKALHMLRMKLCEHGFYCYAVLLPVLLQADSLPKFY